MCIRDSIPSAGPGLTLIILIVLPFVWARPISRLVAEANAILPREGGIYAWAKETFGEFWGFQAGWWTSMYTYISSGAYIAMVEMCIRDRRKAPCGDRAQPGYRRGVRGALRQAHPLARRATHPAEASRHGARPVSYTHLGKAHSSISPSREPASPTANHRPRRAYDPPRRAAVAFLQVLA